MYKKRSCVMRSICIILCAAATACADGSGSPPEAVVVSLTTEIPAGAEVFRCRYAVLPDQPLDVERFSHRYTAGSHHILLYPTSLSPVEAAAFGEDFDCTTSGDLGQVGLAYGASDEPTGEQRFPDGIGMRFAAQQVVLLEAHYLNATDAPITATVEISLFPAQRPIETLAGNLFFYNYAILVPPAPARAAASMRCVLPDEVSLQFASSHMHRRGTHYRADLVVPSGARQVLHETDDWESAEPAAFDPALIVPAGSAVEFTCDYVNDVPTVVTEGESAERDEMCMFIASYWPARDPSVGACLAPGSAPLFGGSESCSAVLACLDGTGETDAIAMQTCLARTCPSSAATIHEFLNCLETSGCESEGCIAERCGAQYLACENATCT
ncbi:MAG: hypothetical protein ACKV2T_25420 [Kofleriaceae bacterium]